MHVLVVEDCALVRRGLRRGFMACGYDVAEAAHGVEALELLGRGRVPDLITVDCDMPMMGGVELIRTLRRDSRFDSARVVMVTAHETQSSAVLAREAGADGYVTKPFWPDAFVPVLPAPESDASPKSRSAD
jgi:two-component system chemotaxis response regulator CheY